MAFDPRPALAPASIAVVGATERSWVGRVSIENAVRLGFGGAIYPVHPRYQEVLGLPCYPALSVLPEVPDCAMIALAAERAAAAVEEAAALGVRAVVLPAGGFAERGPAGVELQRRIADATRARGVCVVGPNCMGTISYPDRCAVYIGTVERRHHSGPVSVIAQSGSIAHLVVDTPEMPLARVISTGNEAATTTCDFLDYLIDDEHTSVIMLHLEAYREPRRLLDLAERALCAGKPLITLAMGRSARAQQMAQAHSGALATSYRRLHAALSQRGVVMCDDLDEWLTTALLAAGTRPRGAAVGAVTVSGGEAGYLLDLAGEVGVSFPPLSAPLQKRLHSRFPDFETWINPSDGWDKGPWEEVIPAMIAALADEPAVDVLVAAIDVPAGQGEHEAEYTTVIGRALGAEAARVGKPALYLSLSGGALDERVRSALGHEGVPVIGGARWGLRAIAHLADFARRAGARGRMAPSRPERAAPALAAALTATPEGTADEGLSRRVLDAAGVPLVPAEEVTTVQEAIAAAARLDGPCVLKAILPGVAHKSDAGAVALRLADAQEVRAAARRLLTLCESRGAPPRLLLSPFIEPAAELFCGVSCDHEWGPFILVGLGGVLAEELDEVALLSAPFEREQAEQTLAAGRLGRVLRSARRPADLDALLQLIMRLGTLAEAAWAVDPTFTIDLNPVMVMSPGRGAWAADALVTRGATREPKQS